MNPTWRAASTVVRVLFPVSFLASGEGFGLHSREGYGVNIVHLHLSQRATRCPKTGMSPKGGEADFVLAMEWRLWHGLRSFPRRPP